jgi:hypothetical protein
MSARDRRGISLSANAHVELARKHEPVTVGVPLPQGVWTPDVKWQLLDVTRSVEIPCQTENLAQWPDGSVKWLSLSFLTSIAANETARGGIRPAENQSIAS